MINARHFLAWAILGSVLLGTSTTVRADDDDDDRGKNYSKWSRQQAERQREAYEKQRKYNRKRAEDYREWLEDERERREEWLEDQRERDEKLRKRGGLPYSHYYAPYPAPYVPHATPYRYAPPPPPPYNGPGRNTVPFQGGIWFSW